MYDRLISLIGQEKFELLKDKKVLVIGVGGVGGYVVEGLVRSGIQDITIIDGDNVEESNLNRQIIALNSTLGKKKVEVLKSRILDINKEVHVNTIDKFLKEEDIEGLNLENYDYVVDCIDDLRVKIALAEYSYLNKINLVISTGTARKLHPEKLSITTLDKTSYDPLAKKMRQSLKKYNLHKFTVLASNEAPIETENNTLGSTAFVPSTGGLLIASYVINDIIK